jgi:hypothetical protein
VGNAAFAAPPPSGFFVNACEKGTIHIRTNDLEKLGREIGALNP